MLEESRAALPAGAAVAGLTIQKVISTSDNGITYAAGAPDGALRVVKEYFPRRLARRQGVGVVYKPADEAAFNEGLQRFNAVGKALLQLRSANIVGVTDVAEANGTTCIVMEYVDGVSLKDVLVKTSLLEEADIRQVVFPVMHGLKSLHQLRICHLAIRPENIMFRADGVPVLVGFAAWYERLAEGGGTVIIPNPGYAAIEQYSAQQGLIGPWTDIYALGAVLYHCIAGTPPPDADQRYRAFKESGADLLVDSYRAKQAEYSDRLIEVIDHALKLSPVGRPPDISSWMQELFDLEPVSRRVSAAGTPAPGNGGPVSADDTDEEASSRYKGYRAWLGGREQSYYMAQFIRQDDSGRLPRPAWNWAAFAFSVFWMASRKMYMAAAVVLASNSLLVFPAARMLVEGRLPMSFIAAGVPVNTAAVAALVFLMLFCGLFGNYLYYLHIGSKVRRAGRKFGDVSSQRKWLSDRGGTSRIAPAALAMLVVVPAFYLHARMQEEQRVLQEQLGEAFTAMNVAAERVASYRRRLGQWPASVSNVGGLPPNAAYRFIADLFITGPMIVVTFKPDGVAAPLADRSLALFATDGQDDRITWTCGSISVPLEHLPPECRRQWK